MYRLGTVCVLLDNFQHLADGDRFTCKKKNILFFNLKKKNFAGHIKLYGLGGGATRVKV